MSPEYSVESLGFESSHEGKGSHPGDEVCEAQASQPTFQVLVKQRDKSVDFV